jgi:hypothetical protein
MFNDSKSIPRRVLLGSGALVGAAAAASLVDRRDAAAQGNDANNFAFGRTDENNPER